MPWVTINGHHVLLGGKGGVSTPLNQRTEGGHLTAGFNAEKMTQHLNQHFAPHIIGSEGSHLTVSLPASHVINHLESIGFKITNVPKHLQGPMSEVVSHFRHSDMPNVRVAVKHDNIATAGYYRQEAGTTHVSVLRHSK